MRKITCPPLWGASEHSIKKDWVEDEVTKVFEEERKRDHMVLFPIHLDDAVMNTNEPWAARLRARHIGDFTCWKDPDQSGKSAQTPAPSADTCAMDGAAAARLAGAALVGL